MSITIQTENTATTFRPGETIRGTISWSLPLPPDHLELQLYWTTRGKGTVDTAVAESLRIDRPAASGDKQFTFPTPNQPYSFSGRLVSVLWGLRLTIYPSMEQSQLNLTISPIGSEINLVT